MLKLKGDGNNNYLTIYSGHDYTLLTVFGLLKAMSTMSRGSGFGCYVIFELWSQNPDDATEEENDIIVEDNRILRVKYNSSPFFNFETNTVVTTSVQTQNEKVLKDYKMSELHALLDLIKEQRAEDDMQMSMKLNQSDSSECNASMEGQISTLASYDLSVGGEPDNSSVVASEDNG